MVRQGEVWWADLGEPVGSIAGYRRPILVVQGDSINASRIATVVMVPLTSVLKWANAPGNVRLGVRATGLDRESVANVSLVAAIDKTLLIECIGKVSTRQLEQVLAGIDVILGR